MAQRELAISYGSFVAGGLSSVYQIHGRIRHTKTFRESVVEFQVLVTGTTEAAFGSACAAIESQFRKPWLALSIVLGSRVLVAFRSPPLHECEPEIEKTGDDIDTGRSRLYTIRVRVSMPADNVSPTGLRDSQKDIIAEASGLRRLVLSGVWTATSSLDAAQAYDAGIDAYAAAVYGALGGTWELIGIPRQEVGRNVHEVAFTREYKEIIYAQSEGTLNDPDIIDQSLNVSREIPAPGDSVSRPTTGQGGGTTSSQPGVVRRLTVLTLNYSAAIAVGVDPRSKYDGIRDYLLSQIQDVLGEGTYALTSEKPTFDLAANNLTVVMTALGATQGAAAFERRVTIRDDEDSDDVLVPAWTGNPYSKYNYKAAYTMSRTLTVMEKRIKPEGGFDVPAAKRYVRSLWSGGTEGIAGANTGGRWTNGRVVADVTDIQLGPSDKRIDSIEIVGSLTRQYYERVVGGTVTR